MEFKVLARIKIYSSEPEKIEKAKEEIEKLEKAKLHSIEEKPMGFGVKVYIFNILLPDEEGIMDLIEKKLREVVGEVTVESVERIG